MASGRQGEIPGNTSLKYEREFSFCSYFAVFSETEAKIQHGQKALFHPAAIESGTSSGIFGAFSSPIGMTRRNTSYDELMDAPMNSPPPDMSVNILWKDPVVPQHRFRNTAEVHSYLSAAEFATWS